MSQENTITKASEVPSALEFPFDLVREDLEAVESEILAQAKEFDPAVEGYVAYVCGTSGKRIRPALSTLIGGATGGSTDEHRRLGVILELVHIASLVHDDIMDGADIRRGAPTASAKWGSTISVLLGDCLFAHGLRLATTFEDVQVNRLIAQSALDVCQGEILQTQRRFDLNLSEDDYYKIIRMKTAALFAAAMQVGARLNGASEEIQLRMRDFGNRLGTAYQIYDDCIDLVGDEKEIGKTLGTDLQKGKLTLPILNLISRASDSQRDKLGRILLEKEPIDINILAGIADYDGALEDALNTAHGILDEARADLEILEDSDEKKALVQITRYLDGLLDGCKFS